MTFLRDSSDSYSLGEVVVDVDAELALRQIADVSHRRDDLVVAPEIFVDGLRLRRRLDHDECFCHDPALFTLARSVNSHESAAARPPHQPLQFQLEEPRQQPRRLQPGSLRNLVEIARLRPASSRPERDRRGALCWFRRVIGAAEVHADRQMPSSSKISSAVSTIFAPSRKRPWAPRLRPVSTLPGTASTSRPCSSAHRAVMSDPLFSPASITTTARDEPADDPVALRKEMELRRRARHELADDRAVCRRSRARAARARGG